MVIVGRVRDADFEAQLGAYHDRIAGLFDPGLAAYFKLVEVEFSLRLSTAAGRAYPSRAQIRLNYRVMKKYPQELTLTYGHELCHLLAYRIYKRRGGHGSEWKTLMRSIGLEPLRCHQLEVKEFQRRSESYTYRCGCRTHQLGKRRHQSARRGRYFCKLCKATLVWEALPA